MFTKIKQPVSICITKLLNGGAIMGKIVGLVINERLEPQKTEALINEVAEETEEATEKPKKKGGKK